MASSTAALIVSEVYCTNVLVFRRKDQFSFTVIEIGECEENRSVLITWPVFFKILLILVFVNNYL